MSNFFKDDVIRKLAAAENQAETILSIIDGALDTVTLTGNDVILGIYIEKEMSPGGLLLPDQRLKESIYQSKVAIVLKVGPDAFKYKSSFAWVSPDPKEIGKDGKFTKAYYARAAKHTPKVGDWVIHFPTDSKLFGLNGVPCRYSLDSSVKMISTRPDAIL
jgi:hypothetical protein